MVNARISFGQMEQLVVIVAVFPTRHSKKDARYSSDSVGGTSAAGTCESASPEK